MPSVSYAKQAITNDHLYLRRAYSDGFATSQGRVSGFWLK